MNRQEGRISFQRHSPSGVASFTIASVLMAGATITTAQAEEWQVIAGAETPDEGSQALAFLPNEFWIHAGDSMRWTFPTHERHTVTFLTPGEVRPFWACIRHPDCMPGRWGDTGRVEL